MRRKPHFEITTQIGCRVNCLKFCPQEIINCTYKGERTLTIENFRRMIEGVPESTSIIFSGLSEPFLNPRTPRMILEAHSRGHPVVVFSTLTGLSPYAANAIKHIPFERFILHLPDPYGVSDIPDTDDYSKSLNIILRNVERLNYMTMGFYFKSDGSQDRIRGKYIPRMRWTPYCDHHEHPDLFTLPNGNVYFCCQTRGQSNLLGNIYEETYQSLLSKHRLMSKEMRGNSNSICYRCSMAYPAFMHPVKKLVGETLIDIGKRYFL
jgi:radical SAM protein with 4Fe4S-binding SPASM domain